MTPPALPRVGISSCLLGEAVRYDGDHRKQSDLLLALEGQVEWVSICPEVELGLGVPRETIQIETQGAELRLITCESRQDLTRAMQTWARERISALTAQRISGYVLKARSPSCGIGSVRVEGLNRKVSGMFAAELARRLPQLPLVEEGDLERSADRELFLQRVHSYYQLGFTKVIG